MEGPEKRKYPKLMESVEIGRDCSKSNGSVWKRTELSEVKNRMEGPEIKRKGSKFEETNRTQTDPIRKCP